MSKKINPFLLFSISIIILLISPFYCFSANLLDITIIEIAAFEKSGYEWIKIYNNSDDEINLEGWKFVENFSDSNLDGSKHSLNEYNNGYILQPSNSAIICQNADNFSNENNEYNGLILDSSWGSLRESGEKIQLIDNEKNIIENFTYIECKTAVLKRKNFASADYSMNNWEENVGENYNDNENENGEDETADENNDRNSDETDGYSNPISSSNNKTDKIKTTATKKIKSDIIINEILPNPAGADNKKEFIELKNIGNRSINLKEWKLRDNSKRIYEINRKDFKTTLIKAKGLFLIYRNISKIALDNYGGETLKLYNPQEKLADKISYKNTISENESYARNKKNKWEWTTSLTPNIKNIIKRYPTAVIEKIKKAQTGELIIFDASDSYDPDGDELFFAWDFGDGDSSDSIRVAHSYLKSGKYNAKLSVIDADNKTDELFFLVEIIKNSDDSSETATADKINNAKTVYPNILISEIFPNPAGADDNEFIEIFNPNNDDINLSGWQLDDNEKGSKAWRIPQNTIIASDSYLAFFKEQTKLIFNNSSDSARVINPAEKIVAQINYDKTVEGASYCADIYNNDWYWTYNLTPDEKNGSDTIGTQSDNIYQYEIEPPSNEKNIKIIDILEINNCNDGDLIETTGVVAAEPGILGKQIFYLNGAKIYMHKSDFPNLKINDAVVLTGEVSITNDQLKIKIKNREDIFPLSRQEELSPIYLQIKDADKNFISRLISINGEIVEKKGNTFWLDDGTGEIIIYINKYTEIDLKQFKDGDFIEIVGMLDIVKDGFRLLPRYQSDIKITKILGKNYATKEDPTNKKFSFAIEEKEKKNYNKYFYITIFGLAIIAVGQIWKYRKNKN
ncbi:MAG: lamin tail domain-containing protein [Patescibacteria group bacterium]|nr:lamin tail domain-containing protein [Patescibacteria group bacterium]